MFLNELVTEHLLDIVEVDNTQWLFDECLITGLNGTK